MQRIAAIEQHPLVHEVHFHLPFVDEQKLLPGVFLEGLSVNSRGGK
jgi:hypothetical protein